jgi:hypothetical protein
MMMANLRERLRSWLARRWDMPGAVPTDPHPAREVSRTMDHGRPPPIPTGELPQLESDIVVIEAEDPDVRAWAEAFTAATSGGAQKS